MRRTIASALLFSSLVFTAAAYASPPPADSSALTRRVSTGITPPKLLDSLNLSFVNQLSTVEPAGAQIGVSFMVDQKGVPRNIRITQGADLIWNTRVVDAVSRLRYRPASLDNQAIPMNMNLVVTLNR